jgi:hypothetical protein
MCGATATCVQQNVAPAARLRALAMPGIPNRAFKGRGSRRDGQGWLACAQLVSELSVRRQRGASKQASTCRNIDSSQLVPPLTPST